MVKKKRLKPIHPGEILREEFIEPLGLRMTRMAHDLRVPVTRIADIVHARRRITADTALRLACYFKTAPSFCPQDFFQGGENSSAYWDI